MNRRWLCVSTALICLCTQAMYARNFFVVPQDPASTSLSTVTADPLAFGASLSSIAGSKAVFATRDAQRFYVVGAGSFDNVAVLTGRFPALTLGSRVQVGGTVTEAEMTPDGTKLVLVGPQGTAVVDAASGAVPTAMGNIDTGASPI